MKHEEAEVLKYIADFQALYGEYNSAQKKVAFVWMSKYCGELPLLYAQVLKSHSWKYKMPPSPTEFEEAAEVVYQNKLEGSRPELQDYKPLEIEEDAATPEQAEAGFAAMKSAIKKPEKSEKPKSTLSIEEQKARLAEL